MKPIDSKSSNAICKKHHYSGKVVPNSQLHFGVYYKGKCEGVMQFGPSMRKDKMLNIVEGTRWNGFIELNRMSFSDQLPRFSESRALAVAHRLIKKHYPHIKWIVSFADATQCGDGAIYRAAGYLLTQIKKNIGQRIDPSDGKIKNVMSERFHNNNYDFYSWEPAEGYMLRYIHFLDKKLESKLNCEPIDYKKIKELKIGMYKGESVQR